MRENHLSATMPYAHMGASTVAHTSPPMSAQRTCVTSLVLITKSAEFIAAIVLLIICDEPLYSANAPLCVLFARPMML